MNLADELNQLGELHARGVLTDDEFARAKSRLLDGDAEGHRRAAPNSSSPAVAAVNSLRRSRDDRWVGGVCGGLARLTGIESWLLRILMVLLVLCAGTGLLVYALLWLFVPEDGALRPPLPTP